MLGYFHFIQATFDQNTINMSEMNHFCVFYLSSISHLSYKSLSMRENVSTAISSILLFVFFTLGVELWIRKIRLYMGSEIKVEVENRSIPL